MAKYRSGLTAYADGQVDPEQVLNPAIDRAWDAGQKKLSKSVGAGDVTLTRAEVQDNGYWELIGAPGVARTVNVPDTDAANGWHGERVAVVKNATDSDLTVGFVTPTATVTLPAGAAAVLVMIDPDVLEAVSALRAAAAVEMADELLSRPHLQDPSEKVATPSSSAGALTLDYEQGPVFEVTLSENVTSVTVANPPASGRAGAFTLVLKQDATGGRTFDFSFAVWAGATVPSVTSAANAVDAYTFLTTDAGGTWYGFVAGQAMG